jgi:uncharacterized protein (DUF1330 family)
VTAYVVYQGVVTDPEGYERYKVLAQESVAAAGGRYVVRGGDVTALEGEAPDGRVVLLEFPSVEAAVAWYDGPAYSEARAARAEVARARMYVVAGVA